MVKKSDEKELLLPAVRKMLEARIFGVNTIIDTKPIGNRDFEIFELFFAFDKNCQNRIDPKTADGAQTIFQIAEEATETIFNRYNDYYKDQFYEIGTIGISDHTEWRFGYDQIPEIEAMINTVHDKSALIGCWKFFIRFAPEIDQIEGRCLAAIITDQTSSFD